MKAFALQPFEGIPDNISHDEFLKHLNHVFPEPGGVLKVLITRYEALADSVEKQEEGLSDAKSILEQLATTRHEVSCPHCGSTIGIDAEIALEE